MAKIKIPMATFIRRNGVYFTIKWSSNQEKEIYLGADRHFTVSCLTIKCNANLEHPYFKLAVNTDQHKAVFTQDEEGDIIIDINDDISIDGYTESVDVSYSTPYIKSYIKRFKRSVREERYIPIKLRY